ncbi:MAG TPA: PQQ-binding-like beta-propeller repeat protein [Bryobacteraceae bacterium]|jgi:outer membrane protein assembly factor BamB|nr:PQQ-binding-like beta-propeller repeat protein [Bryobacteraceae bacterium]
MQLCLLILASAFVCGADLNWTQFRGPYSNPVGADARLPGEWSKTKNVEWSAQIPGRGWSSPIVVGGKVFVTAATTDGKSKAPQMGTDYSNDYIAELMKQGLSAQEALKKVGERDIEMPDEVTLHYFLYCLKLETGAVNWKQEFYSGRPPGGRHRKNSFTSETPVTDGEFVYVFVGNLGLFAYDLNGKQVWTTKIETNQIYLDFGTGGSAALHGNRIVIICDNQKHQFIAAFDKTTGKKLWSTDRDISDPAVASMRSGWTTPYIWTNKARTEIVTTGPGAAISYDLEGKELWRLSGISPSPAPSPFAYDGMLYIDAGQGRPLFALRPGASGNISLGKTENSNEYVAWSQDRAGTYITTPVVYEDGVYVLFDKGILARFDAKTGKQSYKVRIDPDAWAFTSSPWAYNGEIFCQSEEGKTYVITAGETFKMLRVNSLDEMALATPAMVGDRLLVRTEGRLYSIRKPI